jgi:hypothetical protein
MSERFYRLIIGATIILLLIFKQQTYVYILIGLLLFESLTNIRIPAVLARIRGRQDYILPLPEDGEYSLNFESERVARIVFSAVLTASLFLFYEQAWFFAWFLGTMLIIAGISNFCPMIIFLRWLGFK